MLSKRYESTEVDRRTLLHVPSGTHWSTSSDTHQVVESSFPSSFVEFCSVVIEEMAKMSQPIKGQGGHLVIPIGPQNTKLIEDAEILLPVKCP